MTYTPISNLEISFSFFFAGHGGLLRAVAQSPPGRHYDPSLLTADYGTGKRAMRGWQLNSWLESLHKKQVRVVVCLDSCYSGGSWRNGHQGRTPLSLDQDMDVFPPDTVHEKQATSSVSRNTELDTSWSINPDGVTLMAACDSDQLAQETKGSDEKMYGAFTYHLMDVLKNTQPNATLPSYRLLCDQITEALSGSGLDQKQTPGVYGRDGLAFWGITKLLCLPRSSLPWNKPKSSSQWVGSTRSTQVPSSDFVSPGTIMLSRSPRLKNWCAVRGCRTAARTC